MRLSRQDTSGALQAEARQLELVCQGLERSNGAFDGMDQEERPSRALHPVQRNHGGSVGAD